MPGLTAFVFVETNIQFVRLVYLKNVVC